MKSQSKFFAGVKQTKRRIVRESKNSVLFTVSKHVISLARVRVFSLLCESTKKIAIYSITRNKNDVQVQAFDPPK